MRIALNFAFFQPLGGGVKEYMRNLLREMVALRPEWEWDVYVLQDFADYARPLLPKGVTLRLIPFGGGSVGANVQRSLLEGNFWRSEEKMRNWDLFHSPFFHSPRLQKTPVVITLHDLRIYRMPESYALLRRLFLQRVVRKSLRRAEGIICVSDFTKSELAACLPDVEQSRVRVVHEGIEPLRHLDSEVHAAPLPAGLVEGRFLLAVGRLEPRKNYPRLIRAFMKAKQSGEKDMEDMKLVIVGARDHDYAATMTLLKRYWRDVVYLDFVDDSTLNRLYRTALLHVMPSYYEGFGFPPLEAAVRGLPSIVARAGSLPEICGDGAAYFDPMSEDDMSRVIRESVATLRGADRFYHPALPDLKRFSWHHAAWQTIAFYEELSDSKDLQPK